MTDELSKRELELIERWVVDPMELTAAEDAELNGSKACRARMDEFVDSARVLDAASEAAILDLVAEARESEISATPKFEAALAASLPVRSLETKAKSKWFVWMAMAAVIPLCLWGFGLWPDGGGDPVDPYEQELHGSEELVVSYKDGSIVWQARAGTVTAIVRVLQPDSDEKLMPTEFLTGPVDSWTPNQEQLAKMGDQCRVVVELELSDGGGKLRGECHVVR